MTQLAPEVTDSSSTDPLKPSQRWVVLALAGVFAALPFFFIGDLQVHKYEIRDLQASGFFFSLGLLPGAIGIVYHIVTATGRRSKGRETIQLYYAFRNSRPEARAQEKISSHTTQEGSTDPLGAIAASLFLTGIFLLIAVFAGFEASEQKGSAYNGVIGMMYAGIGAYVAVLYYMVARLYANALSSRFLMTSALRTASAVAIGWVFGIVGVTAFAGVPSTPDATSTEALGSHAVLFMVGLFHNMAIEALRKKASKIFGSAEQEETLPLTTIDGIDDTTSDLLTEYGVSSIQHLSTSEPGDLCDRTLLPLDRILDWIDQALLIRYLRANVKAARGIGIRGAINLALVHAGNDTKLLTSIADKVNMPLGAIDNIGRELRADYMVALIYELQQGKPFPATLTASAQPATTLVEASPMMPIRQDAAASSAVQTAS